MARQIILLLFMGWLSFSIAQQLPFGDDLNRWWFLAIPASRNFSILSSNSNPKASQPAALRDDYTYTAGIGAHKLHKRPRTWHEARRTCDEEGGHLAIINSVAEANLIVNLLKQSGTNADFAFIGFHELFAPGEQVTVHSQPLGKAGYNLWAPGEPNNSPGGPHSCGSLYKNGELHDYICTGVLIFVCEIPV